MATLFLWGALGVGGWHLREYRRIQSLFDRQVPFTEEQYRKIRFDPVLLQNYRLCTAHRLPSSLQTEAFRDYVVLCPTPAGLCELGRAYLQIGRIADAEALFEWAWQINPSLVTPAYELFLLYRQEGMPEKMRAWGERLLGQPVKKEGTTTLKMRAYVEQAFLSEFGERGNLP
ncbi:MAG: hypothetical protein LUD68_07135 [Rikenellaceae bacterium]|nr:hypothetical protein [Rikenellaceae bacterium]